MPDRALTNRHSEQWKEIGFQGNNPATDFRGMGKLRLTVKYICSVYVFQLLQHLYCCCY